MSMAALKALRTIKLDMAEKLVMFAFADMANDIMACWPSMATMAARTGMTDRGVRKVVRRLEIRGLLLCSIGGGKSSNRYTLLLDPPEQRSEVKRPDSGQPPRNHVPSPPEPRSPRSLTEAKGKEKNISQPTISVPREDNVHVLPSSVAHTVQSLAVALKGNAKGQPFRTLKPNPRTAAEQIAMIRPKPPGDRKPLTPEQLATIRKAR